MAAKKAGETVVKNGIAELAKRVPPNQALQFKDFQAKHAEYIARVNKQPEKLPNIDWELYRRNVRTDFVKMVDEFEQKYKGVCESFDKRAQQDKSKYFVEIDKLKQQVQAEVDKFKAESNERIKALEAQYAQIKSLIPYEEMTAEEYSELLPEKSFYKYKGEPSFWPHTEDEQGPGAPHGGHHDHGDHGAGGGDTKPSGGGTAAGGGGGAGGAEKAVATKPAQSTKQAQKGDETKAQLTAASTTKPTTKPKPAADDANEECFESEQFKKDLALLKQCIEDSEKKNDQSVKSAKNADLPDLVAYIEGITTKKIDGEFEKLMASNKASSTIVGSVKVAKAKKIFNAKTAASVATTQQKTENVHDFEALESKVKTDDDFLAQIPEKALLKNLKVEATAAQTSVQPKQVEVQAEQIPSANKTVTTNESQMPKEASVDSFKKNLIKIKLVPETGKISTAVDAAKKPKFSAAQPAAKSDKLPTLKSDEIYSKVISFSELIEAVPDLTTAPKANKPADSTKVKVEENILAKIPASDAKLVKESSQIKPKETAAVPPKVKPAISKEYANPDLIDETKSKEKAAAKVKTAQVGSLSENKSLGVQKNVEPPQASKNSIEKATLKNISAEALQHKQQNLAPQSAKNSVEKASSTAVISLVSKTTSVDGSKIEQKLPQAASTKPMPKQKPTSTAKISKAKVDVAATVKAKTETLETKADAKAISTLKKQAKQSLNAEIAGSSKINEPNKAHEMNYLIPNTKFLTKHAQAGILSSGDIVEQAANSFQKFGLLQTILKAFQPNCVTIAKGKAEADTKAKKVNVENETKKQENSKMATKSEVAAIAASTENVKSVVKVGESSSTPAASTKVEILKSTTVKANLQKNPTQENIKSTAALTPVGQLEVTQPSKIIETKMVDAKLSKANDKASSNKNVDKASNKKADVNKIAKA